MASPISNLTAIMEQITEMPFSLLPNDKQTISRTQIEQVLIKVQKDLNGKALSESKINKIIDSLLNIIRQKTLNEYRFCAGLRNFLQGIGTKNSDAKISELLVILDKIINRSSDFWITEEKIENSKLGQEERFLLDKNILENEMQNYALDYFLFMYKSIAEGDVTTQESILFNGLNSLPALVTDALDNDMLKKIVYKLSSPDLRRRMIKDYYVYRQAFIGLNKGSISEQSILGVSEALRQYCLTLLRISIEYKITMHSSGIYFPYGQGTELQNIINQIS